MSKSCKQNYIDKILNVIGSKLYKNGTKINFYSRLTLN